MGGHMKQKDTYKEVRVIEFPCGTARVHIPDITPEERERRLKQIAHSAALLLYPELTSKK
jgi:hypothetical protein